MTNTTLTRMPDRAVTDRTELDRLLDDTVLAHSGMVDDTGSAVVIPTGIARDGDRILIHGSTGSGWLRRVAEGRQGCVTVTDLNGIIVARSSFESSFRYRSAVLFGTFTRLSDPDVSPALDALIDHFLPGRRADGGVTRRGHRHPPTRPAPRDPWHPTPRPGRHRGAGHADPGLVAEDLGRLAHRP